VIFTGIHVSSDFSTAVSCVAFAGSYQLARTSAGLASGPIELQTSGNLQSHYARLAFAGLLAALTNVAVTVSLSGVQVSAAQFNSTLILYLILSLVVAGGERSLTFARKIPIVAALESSSAALARLRTMKARKGDEPILPRMQTLNQRLAHLVKGKGKVAPAYGTLFEYMTTKVSKSRRASKRNFTAPVYTPEQTVDFFDCDLFEPGYQY
jgi:hypothetical protein